ncbi:hypothetical protein QOT17_006848 [Balamuthia mandrillaris]
MMIRRDFVDGGTMADAATTKQVPTDVNDLSLAFLRQVLESHFGRDTALLLRSFSTERVGEKDGFLGAIYRVSLHWEKGVTRGGLPDSLIAKFALADSSGEVFEQFFKPLHIFEREASFYSSFLHSEAFNVFRRFAPCCYCALWDTPSGRGVLLMEDIRSGALRSFRQGLDIPATKLALRALASLHALHWCSPSPSASTSSPSSPFPWLLLPHSAPFPELISGLTRESIKSLKSALGQENTNKTTVLSEQTWKKLEQLAEDVPIIFAEKVEEVKAICHGDLWSSNLLCSLASSLEREERITLIDFQFVQWSNPMQDVAFFLYSSLPCHLLNTQVQDLLAFYHDQVNNFLVSDGKHNYAWEDCQRDFEKAKRRALIQALAGVDVFLMATATASPEQLDDEPQSLPEPLSRIFHLIGDLVATGQL